MKNRVEVNELVPLSHNHFPIWNLKSALIKEYSTNKAKEKNFVFSPYSIQLALSLLTNGSTGSTKSELLNFLEAESLDDLNTRSERVLELFSGSKKGDPVLSLIGGIWIDQSLTLMPSFKENAAKVYKAKAGTVDFQDKAKSKEAIQKVNRWAEESTNGLIKSVLPEDEFNPMILLANALYFKGRWSHSFGSKVTKEEKFYLLGGNSVDLPSMSSGGCDRHIATFDNFKILMLPYESNELGSLSMYIILPNERDGLWSLMDMVCSDPTFIEKYISPCIKKVRVGKFMLPKFKFKYEFDAKEILKAIGLKSPFSGNAELHEMAHGLNSSVSQVIHKSYIDVNEEGTEAAGVTVIVHYSYAYAELKRPDTQFVADHPFMFMVRHHWSGTVLFMGHVVNPLSQ